MSREIYERAFGILKTQNDVCNKLESTGLRFEYGDGFVGKALESLMNDSEIIIRESLGLHEVSEKATCAIDGFGYPITIEILYTDENDPDWSVTADDFCEFFYKAINNEKVRELMWNAMINKDGNAKDEYNKLGIGRIGGY